MRVDPDGMADVFVFMEADLYLFGGAAASGGIVNDFSKPENSGVFYSFSNEGLGKSVGIGFGAGFTLRDVEGFGGELDFNLADFSITVLFDDKGFNGAALSLGPGGGYSMSAGETKNVDLYQTFIKPFNEAVYNALEPSGQALINSSAKRTSND